MVTHFTRSGIALIAVAHFAAVCAYAGEKGESAAATVSAAAYAHRMRLDFDGETFSGPAWQRLLQAGRGAQFLLIGEEHGIAENPKLAAQLFRNLVDDGYSKLLIEASPPMAKIMDAVIRDRGLDGLQHLFSQPGGEPAFFGMQEEAELLVAVREALPDSPQVLWGVDYEVASDRPLLKILDAHSRPAEADAALEKLKAASADSWTRHGQTRSPQFIFSFVGDPSVVQELHEAWPDAARDVRSILDTLQATFEINQLWVQGRSWQSNQKRAALLRANFLRYWRSTAQLAERPKIIAKLGASHLMRGLSTTGVFDLGTLLPEIAAEASRHSVSILVLPGKNAKTAVFDPSHWTYNAKPAKDGYARGLDAVTGAAYSDAFTLIDLEPIRPIVGTAFDRFGAELVRVVHGFDMVLVMTGSTASRELTHQ